MNKRGNIYFGIAVALIIWTMGIFLLPFLTDDITTFRAALSCSSTSISDGTKITCLAGDGLVPYFILLLSSLTIGYLTGVNT